MNISYQCYIYAFITSILLTIGPMYPMKPLCAHILIHKTDLTNIAFHIPENCLRITLFLMSPNALIYT